jgi:hypothetical protein
MSACGPAAEEDEESYARWYDSNVDLAAYDASLLTACTGEWTGSVRNGQLPSYSDGRLVPCHVSGSEFRLTLASSTPRVCSNSEDTSIDDCHHAHSLVHRIIGELEVGTESVALEGYAYLSQQAYSRVPEASCEPRIRHSANNKPFDEDLSLDGIDDRLPTDLEVTGIHWVRRWTPYDAEVAAWELCELDLPPAN